jgi:hypothetical protein
MQVYKHFFILSIRNLYWTLYQKLGTLILTNRYEFAGLSGFGYLSAPMAGATCQCRHTE